MEIRGELKTIIYQNEINSYLIAEIETEEELLTIVGYLPFVNVGDTLKIEYSKDSDVTNIKSISR